MARTPASSKIKGFLFYRNRSTLPKENVLSTCFMNKELSKSGCQYIQYIYIYIRLEGLNIVRAWCTHTLTHKSQASKIDLRNNHTSYLACCNNCLGHAPGATFPHRCAQPPEYAQVNFLWTILTKNARHGPYLLGVRSDHGFCLQRSLCPAFKPDSSSN